MTETMRLVKIEVSVPNGVEVSVRVHRENEPTETLSGITITRDVNDSDPDDPCWLDREEAAGFLRAPSIARVKKYRKDADYR